VRDHPATSSAGRGKTIVAYREPNGPKVMDTR
jgi:hypothetical protein